MRRVGRRSRTLWCRRRHKPSSGPTASRNTANHCSSRMLVSSSRERVTNVDLIWAGIKQAVWLLITADQEIVGITWLSLRVSITATVISLLLGIPSGTALALRRFPVRHLAISLVNTGMGLPPVVVGLFISILLFRSGPLGFLELLYTPTAIIIAQVIIAAPIVTGLTLAAMQQIPARFRLQML